VERFTNLRAQRTEHGPDHEAEIEVEKGSEERGPVAGIFEFGKFQLWRFLEMERLAESPDERSE
jgi:hypothetical protein